MPGAKPPASIADGRFEITERLASGCFSEVYRGNDTAAGTGVAVKCESCEANAPQLKHEAEVLQKLQGLQGFANLYHFGVEGPYSFLVMELLGLSLEDQLQRTHGKFQPETVARIAEQTLDCLEHLHSKGVVLRDVKPENFMCGVGEKTHHIYLIDFGLCKQYFGTCHVQMRQKLSLTGTARYASINAHRGLEQSRRDDLEALGYIFTFMMRGSLPWMGIEAKTKQEKYRQIVEQKETIPLGMLLCGYPPAFETYLVYCRNLGFKELPDYAMLRGLFKTLGKGTTSDLPWIKEEQELLEFPQHQAISQPDGFVRPAELAKQKGSHRQFLAGCAMFGILALAVIRWRNHRQIR